MKFIIPILVLLLSACGSSNSDKCASSYTGTWNGTSIADSFTASSACTFEYTGTGCKSIGLYAAPLGASGSLAVTIASVTGSGSCLPVGTVTCSYSTNGAGTTMALNCGSGSLNYSKQ